MHKFAEASTQRLMYPMRKTEIKKDSHKKGILIFVPFCVFRGYLNLPVALLARKQ